MIAFEVYLNGEKLCTAGIGELGVLTAMLNWTHVRKIGTKEIPPEDLEVSVTGMDSSTGEFPKWLRRAVALGDEIRIKIIRTARVDDPVERPALSGGPQEIEKQAFRIQAKEWGWSIKE